MDDDARLTRRRVEWSGPASRRMDALAQRHPTATNAIVEFVYGPLAEHPRRVGKPPARELAGRYSARRGTFRIIYRITDDAVVIEAVGHRSTIYRPT